MDDRSAYQTVAERSLKEELALKANLGSALDFYQRDLQQDRSDVPREDAVRAIIEIIDAEVTRAVDKAAELMDKRPPPPPWAKLVTPQQRALAIKALDGNGSIHYSAEELADRVLNALATAPKEAPSFFPPPEEEFKNA